MLCGFGGGVLSGAKSGDYMLCAKCSKWVHKKCSRVKSSLEKLRVFSGVKYGTGLAYHNRNKLPPQSATDAPNGN